ncbi:hypothetical protein ACIBH1_11275 [Nonomuraea sp. NPDC050663]|uniref:hypothetical protein n=1 Tax=Nonomuraea sp. NPDC050663 TaxID=3364370 RepID=UPI003798F0D5
MRLKLIVLVMALCAPVTVAVVPASADTGTAGRPDLVAGTYLPLWPFATRHEAARWQRAYREGGHQPWHLDAGETALAFTRGYLGFTEIDKAVAVAVDGRHARVRVGYLTQENPKPLVAAVVHLVRYGKGADAPWEVVGTDDTTMTLDKPRYGSAVRSPVKAGGIITGVDESIRVRMLQLGAKRALGEVDRIPAGGERQPWSAGFGFRKGKWRVATIVASTGGHVADVERFAITGVVLR